MSPFSFSSQISFWKLKTHKTISSVLSHWETHMREFDFVELKQSPPDLPDLVPSDHPSNTPMPPVACPTLIPDDDVPLLDPAHIPPSPPLPPSPSLPTHPLTPPAIYEELYLMLTSPMRRFRATPVIPSLSNSSTISTTALPSYILSLLRTLQLPMSLIASLTLSSFIGSLAAAAFATSAISLMLPKAPLC